jgi:hypothetical protein
VGENLMKGNWIFYEDHYGNQYSYFVVRQSDGKFHAKISNTRSGKIRWRKFSKRNMAKQWCIDNCNKAKAKQLKAIAETKAKKELKQKQKRIVPKEEKKLIEAMKKISHYETLVKKCNTKIKTMTTRSKTYQKKIKKYNKQVEKITKEQKRKTWRVTIR